jgi:hypothetical protein
MHYSYSSESGIDRVGITAVTSEPMSADDTMTLSIAGDNTETITMKRLNSTHYYGVHDITTTSEGTCTCALSGAKDVAGNTITASAPTNSTFPINDPDTEAETANTPLTIFLEALLGAGIVGGAGVGIHRLVKNKRQ